MESRMRGKSHVRFGAGDAETCPGNGARRFIPTLPVNPAGTLTLVRSLNTREASQLYARIRDIRVSWGNPIPASRYS